MQGAPLAEQNGALEVCDVMPSARKGHVGKTMSYIRQEFYDCQNEDEFSCLQKTDHSYFLLFLQALTSLCLFQLS